ncbi:MAG: hypothetical protein H0U18_04550 [Pyrinomonadaceae bacterium]|nr:hypothetical protein [Pyrinomonadaceae bacterium]
MKINQISISLKSAQANLDRFCDVATSDREVTIIERPAGANVRLLPPMSYQP